MKECILYEKEKNGKVRCLACAHKCLIGDGKTGICGVRENSNGKLFLLVYGKIAAIHVNPIKKKPLYHFLPGTKAYSIGTVGCNFKCDFCQNWDISQISKGKRAHVFGKNPSSESSDSEKSRFDAKAFIFGDEYTPEEIVESAIKTGCKSIAYTYNEPIIFIEFVKDCAELAHKKGLKNIMVTNGYWSRESFDFIVNANSISKCPKVLSNTSCSVKQGLSDIKNSLIDAVNIDLKGSDKYYNKLCGGKLKPVLDTIKRCYEHGIHVEITTLIVPGENDYTADLKKIAKFIASVDKNIPWHISRFFPMYKMKNKEITSRKILEKAYEIGKKAGLKNVYLGNL